MMSAVPFTPEQRAAIEHCGGLLLTANAGSGKTSVMAERYVRAALGRVPEAGPASDLGVDVGRILAITFTEKAATELRSRVRERFEALGDGERARATEAAWISTIHGFCARLLRTHALAAGLDPRFTVLDEDAAARHAGAAFDAALDDLVAAHGEAALELIAAYRPFDLRLAILGVHGELRSRGMEEPALPPARPAPLQPRHADLALARAQAAVEVDAARDGATVDRARERLAACAALLERPLDPPPHPREVAALALPRNGAALAGDGCAAYREALGAFADACADAHALPVLALLDALLQRFARRYAEQKRAASALDFEDLELRANRLLREHEPLRARYAERFLHVMVDEFQDTNPLQLELLERIAGEELFAVGDELQSIYGFRHADVRVFRRLRAARAQQGQTATLATNFRSRRELLDTLNAAFAPRFGASFTPLVAGAAEAAGEAGPVPDGPRVELLVTDCAADWESAGLVPAGTVAPAPLWRIAEARLLAARIRALLDGGRAPGEIVVLLRATGDLAVYERALVELGVPTYVIGGRGYWSQQQVRDLVAYLAVLANPRDGLALATLLASPLVGLSADALVQLAAASRESGRDAWWTLTGDRGGDGAAATQAPPTRGAAEAPAGAGAFLDRLDADDRARVLALRAWLPAERRAAPRHSFEALLDRVLMRTGYDLTLLRMDGGARRWANVRKLLRLAREHEAEHGRDLRGFVDLVSSRIGDAAGDREAEAPVEGEALDAVRLMTIHRAKGLEFPVVCVADLGRTSPPAGRELIRVGDGGRVGVKLKSLDGASGRPALAYRALGEERARAEAEEEARLFYVAMTRAKEQLILSGAVACDPWPEQRPGAAPLSWIGPAFIPDMAHRAAPDAPAQGTADRDGIHVAHTIARPETLATIGGRRASGESEEAAPGTDADRAASEAAPGTDADRAGGAEAGCLCPTPSAEAPAPATGPARSDAGPAGVPQHEHAPPPIATLSYTTLQEHARCGYRFYLERVLRLPPTEERHAPRDEAPVGPALEALARGRLVHALLERIDLARPEAPDAAAVLRAAARAGTRPTAAEAEEIAGLVAALLASPLRGRLAAATGLRREQPFALPLDVPGHGPIPLVGVFDAIAQEQCRTLVVDWKSDRLDGVSPAELVARGYQLQRAAYALAALSDGAQEVEVIHCFLERPEEPVGATFREGDAAALAADLATRAAAILSRDFAVAPDPQPRICDGCPGRGSLCSWPIEATRGAPEGRLF